MASGLRRLFITNSGSAVDETFLFVIHIGAGQHVLPLSIFAGVACRLRFSTLKVEMLTVHLKTLLFHLSACVYRGAQTTNLGVCPFVLRLLPTSALCGLCLRSAQQISVPSPSPAPGRGPLVTLFQESLVSSSSPLRPLWSTF